MHITRRNENDLQYFGRSTALVQLGGMLIYGLDWSTRAQRNYEPDILHMWARLFGNTNVRIQTRRFPSRWYEALSSWRFIKTSNYRNRSAADQGQDTGTVLHHLYPTEKGEARIIYLQDNQVLKDREDAGLLHCALLHHRRKPNLTNTRLPYRTLCTNMQMTSYCEWASPTL